MKINDFLKLSPFSRINHHDSEVRVTTQFSGSSYLGSQMLCSDRASNLALAYQFIDTGFDETARIKEPLELTAYICNFVDPSDNAKYSAWVLDLYERQKIKQADFPQIRSILSLFKESGLNPVEINRFESLNDLYHFVQKDQEISIRKNRQAAEHFKEHSINTLNVHENESAQFSVLVSLSDSEAAIGSTLGEKAMTGRTADDFLQAIAVKSLSGNIFFYQEMFPESITDIQGNIHEFKSIPKDAQRLFYYSWAGAGMQSPLLKHFSTDVATARASLPGLRHAMLDISPSSQSYSAQELYFSLLDSKKGPMEILQSRSWNIRQLAGLIKNQQSNSEFFLPILYSIQAYQSEQTTSSDKQNVPEFLLDSQTEQYVFEYPEEAFSLIAIARISNSEDLGFYEREAIAEIATTSTSSGEILDAMNPSQLKDLTPFLLDKINQASYLSAMQISNVLVNHPESQKLHESFVENYSKFIKEIATPSESASYFSRGIQHFCMLVSKDKVSQSVVENLFSSSNALSHPDLRRALLRSSLSPEQGIIDLLEKESDTDFLTYLSSQHKNSWAKDIFKAKMTELKANLAESTGIDKNYTSIGLNNLNHNSTNEIDKNIESTKDGSQSLDSLASLEIKLITDQIDKEQRSGLNNDNTN